MKQNYSNLYLLPFRLWFLLIRSSCGFDWIFESYLVTSHWNLHLDIRHTDIHIWISDTLRFVSRYQTHWDFISEYQTCRDLYLDIRHTEIYVCAYFWIHQKQSLNYCLKSFWYSLWIVLKKTLNTCIPMCGAAPTVGFVCVRILCMFVQINQGLLLVKRAGMEKGADIVCRNFWELWKFLDCGRLLPSSAEIALFLISPVTHPHPPMKVYLNNFT